MSTGGAALVEAGAGVEGESDPALDRAASFPTHLREVTTPTSDIEKVLSGVKTGKVEEVLAEGFVRYQDIARVLTRALRTQKNVIFWGPAGHGKSTMVEAALRGLGLWDDTFVLDFGEGSDEASMWGGLDFKRLHEEHELDYNPERSFLNSPITIFEELFDAPPQVLCALKNTLTAKRLHKSATPYDVKTKVIIVCTNKNPDEIASLGPSAKALIERFPLQYEVKWDDYSAKSYAEMFDAVGFDDSSLNQTFADIVASSSNGSTPVSPRTAVHAMQIIDDARKERRARKIDSDDLRDLKFIPELKNIGEEKSKEFEAKLAVTTTKKTMEAVEERCAELAEEFELSSDPELMLEITAELSEIESQLENLTPPDKFKDKVAELLEQVQDFVVRANEKAVKLAARKKGGRTKKK